MIAKIILRIQGSAFVSNGMRRRMLNAIGADIHPTANIENGCRITSHRIRMGEGAFINAQAFIDATEWLIMETGARMAVRCIIITRTHGISDNPERRSDHSKDKIEPVTIGAGSWVGAGCTILPGVTVAGGCVIGAGTVVAKSTEPNGVYVGASAARRVKELPIR